MDNSFLIDLEIDKLNRQQIGQFGSFWLKMYLTGLGFKIDEFKEAVGNQFSVQLRNRRKLYISPKTLRMFDIKSNYAFITKDNWQNKLDEDFYLGLVLISGKQLPDIYLIPALTWQKPNSVFVDMNYEKKGLKSKPEWGVRVSVKNLEVIKEFEIKKQLHLFQ